MDIIIIKCPHCDEPVGYKIHSDNHKGKIEKQDSKGKLECFDLIKKQTFNKFVNAGKDAQETYHEFDDLLNYRPNAEISLGKYFISLREKIKAIRNMKDLHNLRKEIFKSKVIVKRPLKKEFERQKKKFIANIDKKIKRCKK